MRTQKRRRRPSHAGFEAVALAADATAPKTSPPGPVQKSTDPPPYCDPPTPAS